MLDQQSGTNDEWLSGVMFMSDRRGLIEQSWNRGRTGWRLITEQCEHGWAGKLAYSVKYSKVTWTNLISSPSNENGWKVPNKFGFVFRIYSVWQMLGLNASCGCCTRWTSAHLDPTQIPGNGWIGPENCAIQREIRRQQLSADWGHPPFTNDLDQPRDRFQNSCKVMILGNQILGLLGEPGHLYASQPSPVNQLSTLWKTWFNYRGI